MYVKWVQGKQQQIFPPVALKHRWMDTIFILKLAQPCCNSQTRNKFFHWYTSIFWDIRIIHYRKRAKTVCNDKEIDKNSGFL